MADDLFPSGPLVWFYNYGPGARQRMDLHLDFGGGPVTGDGNDDVGRFLIRGKCDSAKRECHWTKTYPGSHEVYYRGFREGKGIWGTGRSESSPRAVFTSGPKASAIMKR